MVSIIEALRSLEEDARRRKVPILHIDKAKWLAAFVAQHQPKRVLELGTAVGYSGTILGTEGAFLLTVDTDESALRIAHETFTQFGITSMILKDEGVAVCAKFASIDMEPFDIVFIDFAKKKYLDVLPHAISLCKVGGYIIADNVLMEALTPFVAAIKADDRLETQIVSLGDGMSVSRRLK